MGKRSANLPHVWRPKKSRSQTTKRVNVSFASFVRMSREEATPSAKSMVRTGNLEKSNRSPLASRVRISAAPKESYFHRCRYGLAPRYRLEIRKGTKKYELIAATSA